MIFVTVGADLPFNRLIEHLDLWSQNQPDQRVFAQIGRVGPSDYIPRSMQWTEMLPAHEFERYCFEARLIVAHAGMGSIINALASGKPIVILPRSARLRETRSDHQFTTAERFADRPGVFVAWADAELPDVIERALCTDEEAHTPRLPGFAPSQFTERLRSFLLQDQ